MTMIKWGMLFVLFGIACWLLSYASAMVLFVPADRGHYFDRDLLVYGALPLLISAILFAIVGILSARVKGSNRIGRFIGNTIYLGLSVVVIFYIVMSIIGNLRQK